ncbi:MAG TPA: NADPH-dependent F420 reductase [Burkholderiales bacterium]|nr:NADPH-dependent F420 reductase [Burkholderiales bacterium]
MQTRPVLAILGGTGALGTGLAMRWAAAGYPVIVGSRTRDKAEDAARRIEAANGAPAVRGAENKAAAAAGEIVVIAVPWASHDAMLDEIRDCIAGKIVVDAVVPLVPPKVSVAQLPPEGSAAQIAQKRLGTAARVVSAFHNVAAAKLSAGGPVDCDVLVFGDDREARDTVIALADAAGTRGLDGGALANSVAAEALTSVIIGINRRYKATAGIRITGIAEDRHSRAGGNPEK